MAIAMIQVLVKLLTGGGNNSSIAILKLDDVGHFNLIAKDLDSTGIVAFSKFIVYTNVFIFTDYLQYLATT